MRTLPGDFYRRGDATKVAADLLGKVLCTRIDERVTSAFITETEAYAGPEDRASHAWNGRRTRRTEPMFAEGGIAYVYLCYGIHHLFNVVTSTKDDPKAVLVRAGWPLTGLEHILERRGRDEPGTSLLGGPGSLARGLGIRTGMTGTSLTGGRIWIEDHDFRIPADDVIVGPRVGIDYAGEDAALPYRFRVTPAAVRRIVAASEG